jgi:hypothetical protein
MFLSYGITEARLVRKMCSQASTKFDKMVAIYISEQWHKKDSDFN